MRSGLKKKNKAGFFCNKLFKNCFFFKKWKYCLEDSLLMNTESYKLMKTHLQIAHNRDVSKHRFWRVISIKTCCCNVFYGFALCNLCYKNGTFWKIFMRGDVLKKKQSGIFFQQVVQKLFFLQKVEVLPWRQPADQHGILQVDENTPTDSTQSWYFEVSFLKGDFNENVLLQYFLLNCPL